MTHEQISTLFWINLAVGVGLAACTILLAPAVVRFYGEPRLYWITIVTGAAFIFNGLAAQHGALISREMRFATQARIDLTALAASSAVGVVMAFLGWRYWSLVGMGVVSSIVTRRRRIACGSVGAGASTARGRRPLDASVWRASDL